MEKDPNEWILNLEGLQIQMNDFGLKSSTLDEDFIIQVLNNLPREYDVILGKLESCPKAP